MTVMNPPPDFVIRLGDVLIDRASLAEALGTELDRYGKSRSDSTNYAQISPAGDVRDWQEVVQFLNAAGPRIRRLIDQGSVGSVCIDFAVSLDESTYAKFFTVPAAVAEGAGRHSIDVEVSVYATAP